MTAPAPIDRAEYIRRIVASIPPLAPWQRERIRALMRPIRRTARPGRTPAAPTR